MKASPESINHNANLLVELAGALGAGRPDHELSRKGCAPASPDDLSAEITKFADFASDQYQDVVAILSALSTKLKNTAAGYQETDQETAARLDTFLRGSTYVPPGKR